MRRLYEVLDGFGPYRGGRKFRNSSLLLRKTVMHLQDGVTIQICRSGDRVRSGDMARSCHRPSRKILVQRFLYSK